MPRSIVFGGSGFLGSHVADALSDAGHEVVIFDLRPSPYLRADQRMEVGSILDADRVSACVAGCDYVFHFAGIASLDDATTRPRQTVVANVEGTVVVLEAARQAKIQRFVYAGTLYVYSNKGGFYRCSKQAAESYIEEYQTCFGLDYTILRFGTLYGPRADGHNSVHRTLQAALVDKKLVCTGTGDEIREYVHAKDAAALSVSVLEPQHKNQRVIITGQHRMRYGDFIEMVKEIFQDKIEVIWKLPEDADPAHSAHYRLTPYSFTPKAGYKLTGPTTWDLGQGLLECVEALYASLKTDE